MIRKLLAALALLMPGVAHADWYEASSAHFVVYSDDRPDRIEKFAAELERFDKVLRVIRQIPDDPVGPANRVTVYVLGDVADIQRLAGNSSIAGYYQPRAGESNAFVPRSAASNENDLSARVILFHEYAHHFMVTSFPHVVFPRWFTEGFAEFFAPTVFAKDGAVEVGRPPQYRAWGILGDNTIAITRMLGGDTEKLDDQQANSLYGRGWLLLHYLTATDKRPGQLKRYIDALNQGVPPAKAAQDAFGDLRKLDRELQGYATGRITFFRVAARAVPAAPVTVRKLSPAEAAIMPARIRSKNGVTSTTAPSVYAAARKAAAPYPHDPFVQVALAEAAYDAQDYTASQAAADRAIAADPKRLVGYDYRAMALMAIARKADDHRPATWSAIRRAIATANHLDPEDPRPLVLYYQSFVMADQKPSDSAKAGLLKAFDLAPQDPGLRLNTAAMELVDGKKDEARELLKPLAYDPHNGGLAAFARTLIDAIDSGKSDEALQKLRNDDGAAAAGAGKSASH